MRNAYIRPIGRELIDGEVMVEIAPHEFVNAASAIALGLVARGEVPRAQDLED